MRRKRVDSEDDLDGTLSDTTPPPSIHPHKSVSRSPKKAKTFASANKNPSNETNKVKVFRGAIELTDSENDKKTSQPKKTLQKKKKKPPSSEIIDLCSDEDEISKSPTKQKNNYVIQNDVVVILSSDEELEEKTPSSSRAPPHEDRNLDSMYCGTDSPHSEAPRKHTPLNSSRSSQVEKSSTATFISAFSPPTNLPPRVITFSDSLPTRIPMQSHTSLYFSRSLARSSLSYKQTPLKSTKSGDCSNFHAKPSPPDVQPLPLPPLLESPSPSISPEKRHGPTYVSKLLECPRTSSHAEVHSSLSENTPPRPILATAKKNRQLSSSSSEEITLALPSGNTRRSSVAKVAKSSTTLFLRTPSPEDVVDPPLGRPLDPAPKRTKSRSPLFLPSPSPEDIVSSDSIPAVVSPSARVSSSSEDIIVNNQHLLSDDIPPNMEAPTLGTIDEMRDCTGITNVQISTNNEEEIARVVLSTPSQTIDISTYSDIPGIDAIILTEALEDDLDGLELGYPEWSP